MSRWSLEPPDEDRYEEKPLDVADELPDDSAVCFWCEQPMLDTEHEPYCSAACAIHAEGL